jgi:succinate dehydrogenase / fumarate reductase cytochrome b subunit
VAASSASFMARHEFLIRRLHSLSGLIPVGAYMCVHLVTNSTLLDSPGTFQNAVYAIHSLGAFLPIVEWTFIFLPILFHAIVGVIIIRGGLPNSSSYPYARNIRYTLQRASGMIAFLFIVWHVFQLHGWFHFESWLEVAKPLGGAQFHPYAAASSVGLALQGVLVQVLYAVGILSCVFHLANGIWTMGITWGVWTSRAAQKRADIACAVFGVLLAAVGLGALGGAATVDVEEAKAIEDKIYNAKLAAGEINPNPHKRGDHADHGPAAAPVGDEPAAEMATSLTRPATSDSPQQVSSDSEPSAELSEPSEVTSPTQSSTVDSDPSSR